VLEDKGLRNDGTDAARTEQAGQGNKEMDKQNDQIAHRRIVAGREILRKYGQNNNSPATGIEFRVTALLPVRSACHSRAYKGITVGKMSYLTRCCLIEFLVITSGANPVSGIGIILT